MDYFCLIMVAEWLRRRGYAGRTLSLLYAGRNEAGGQPLPLERGIQRIPRGGACQSQPHPRHRPANAANLGADTRVSPLLGLRTDIQQIRGELDRATPRVAGQRLRALEAGEDGAVSSE